MGNREQARSTRATGNAARRYTVGELAKLSGTTVRTLRHYDAIGLLAPAARGANGYRAYGPAEVDRLQEILLYRRMGMALGDIAPLLSDSPAARHALLARHLEALRRERRKLDGLIGTVERSLADLEGAPNMTDSAKFEGLKREALAENERRYGAELREKHGDAAIDASNRKMMGMSEQDYARFTALEQQIKDALVAAVHAGTDPAGAEGARICALHREWLCFSWPAYSPEAHRGLAESYVADERFRTYYDRDEPGCAQWLRDAIAAHAR